MYFIWKDIERIAHRGRGVTLDVSSRGMFIRSLDTHPPPGSLVWVEAFVALEGGATLELKAKAHVIRVEPANKEERSGGFAVASKSTVMHRRVMQVVQ